MSDPGYEGRLSRVEQRVDDHERRCTERMNEIRTGTEEMKSSIREIHADAKAAAKANNRTLLAVLISILAFLGKEVWDTRGAAAVAAVAAIHATAGKP
jgi:CHASE3 domain sensor protein